MKIEFWVLKTTLSACIVNELERKIKRRKKNEKILNHILKVLSIDFRILA
jgi:hypothetical protein